MPCDQYIYEEKGVIVHMNIIMKKLANGYLFNQSI